MAISTGMALLGGLSAASSLAGGFMSSGGAQAGGAAAAAASQNAATQNANIQRDQQKINRVDASPYMSLGRNATDMLSQLYGWGGLTTGGGDDQWWSTGGADGRARGDLGITGPADQASIDAQRKAAETNLLRTANVGWKDVATPTFNTNWGATPNFNQINVPTTFEADPGYAWRIAEGNKALDRSASSRGSLFSGGQLKALTDWNQGAASQEYGNWWNRYTQGTGFNNQVAQQGWANRFGALQYGNQLLQQDYGNRYGQSTDQYNRFQGVLRNLSGMVDTGRTAAGGLSGTNSSLSANIGNGFMSAGTSGGNALGNGISQGANYLASGIGSGVNNLITAGALGGAFGGGSSWGSIPAPPTPTGVASVGGQPTGYYRGWT